MFFKSAQYYNLITNEDWNSFEKLLCQYLQFLDYCFSENDNVQHYFSEPEIDSYGDIFHRFFTFKIKDVFKLPTNVLQVLNLFNPLDQKLRISTNESFNDAFSYLNNYPEQRELFFKVAVNSNQINSTKEYVLNILLIELNKRLTSLEESLKNFIKIKTSCEAKCPVLLLNQRPKMVVSFNYSKTVQRLFNVDDSNIAYIHGDFSSSIVIGIESSMITNQSFDEESDFILFF